MTVKQSSSANEMKGLSAGPVRNILTVRKGLKIWLNERRWYS